MSRTRRAKTVAKQSTGLCSFGDIQPFAWLPPSVTSGTQPNSKHDAIKLFALSPLFAAP
jgi:hypothetical protein